MQAYYAMMESENAVIWSPSLSLGRLLGEALSTGRLLGEALSTGRLFRALSKSVYFTCLSSLSFWGV
jgi:hypothetical protein